MYSTLSRAQTVHNASDMSIRLAWLVTCCHSPASAMPPDRSMMPCAASRAICPAALPATMESGLSCKPCGRRQGRHPGVQRRWGAGLLLAGPPMQAG